MIWLTAPLLGIVLGYLGHGRLRHLAGLPLPVGLLAIAWLALGLELVAQLFPKVLEFAAVMTGTMLVFAFLAGFWVLLGRRSFGRGVRMAVVILAVGWLMNTAVIGANGGMPVSTGALEQVGLPQVAGTRRSVQQARPADARDRAAAARRRHSSPVPGQGCRRQPRRRRARSRLLHSLRGRDEAAVLAPPISARGDLLHALSSA